MASHTLAPFPEELLAAKKQIRERARAYGLDFFPVIFEMCDYEQMNQIAAYGGFPQRYPHWRFGSEYEGLRKRHHYGLGRIYEMVINNDPCYAYLQESNQLVDQKLVIAHVYGHCDFFKNNLWFSQTNRKMMDEMANHATHVRKHIEKHGYDVVERWLDICLSIEHLIDPHSMFLKRGPSDPPKQDERREEPAGLKFKSKDYLDRWINPPDKLAAEAKKLKDDKAKARHATPVRPTRDVLQYLLDHARLEDWQADCLAIVREESYYYAPQAMTKVMNEGWACLHMNMFSFTDRGVLRMGDIVQRRLPVRVSDGQALRSVYDWAKFEDRDTVWIRTRRGYELEGSTTHRLLLPAGNWRRLDELHLGDQVQTTGGSGIWARRRVRFSWMRKGVSRIAETPRRGPEYQDLISQQPGAALGAAVLVGTLPRSIRVPAVCDEAFASLLGYLIGDGHISEVKRVIGLTTGDEEQADRFAGLVESIFGVRPRKRWDADERSHRWRIVFTSKNVERFLKHLGMRTGVCASNKVVPDCILRSPKPVVAAFLRAYFDCDGYAGKQGVILSTSSEGLGKVVQLLLLNFGILSSRRAHKDGCWHVHITGRSCEVFEREIGFGLTRKQEALRKYLGEHRWFLEESWDDEIVAIERRRADVYDISVEGTHRYAAQGFINHNSFWHSTLMTKHFVEAKEVIDYADHHSGTVHMPPGNFNPYKVGIELFRDIEDRWNKGKFGKEYEEADNLGEKKRWDKGLGLGREKIFEVRRVYNDVNFIDEFMTPEFIEKHKFYQYGRDPHTGQLRIISRDPVRIKQTLLYHLTNMGQPFIYVVDGNYCNRGELYLAHKHNGLDIEIKYAVETLKNIHKVWQRPVHLQARIDDDMILFTYDGHQPKQQTIHDDLPKPAHQVAWREATALRRFVVDGHYNVFMTLQPTPPCARLTIEEYLRLETESTEKHEYHDGELVAMAGGSAQHSLIIMNVGGEMRQRLKGKPRRVYDSNLRVRIPRTTLYVYPDVSVICGKAVFDPKDVSQTTVTNPRVLVEVLSPSTEAFDRTRKFRDYLSLDSLQEYVLVSQEEPRVEMYFRQGDGTWLFSVSSGLEGSIKFRSLGIEVPLAEAYANVEFPPASEGAEAHSAG